MTLKEVCSLNEQHILVLDETVEDITRILEKANQAWKDSQDRIQGLESKTERLSKEIEQLVFLLQALTDDGQVLTVKYKSEGHA